MPAVAVEMTSWDLKLAKLIADQRSSINNNWGVLDRRGDRSENRIEVTGLMGEICFAKWANAYLDLTWKPRSGGHDIIIDGKTYDIKTNRRVDGDMNVNAKKANSPSDYYVLVTGELSDDQEFGPMFVQGFVRPQTVFKEENMRNNRGSVYYTVKRSSMRRFKKT